MQIVQSNIQSNLVNQRSSQVTKPTRERIIDLLRGFAVALMIITHVIALTYDSSKESNSFIPTFGLIGGIGSFTTFLFISGVAGFYSYINIDKNSSKASSRRSKIFGAFVKIFIVYYLLAFASVFVNTSLLSFPPSASWIGTIINVLFFFNVPEFTEFLIPLGLFTLSLIFLKDVYKFILNNKLIGLFLSILIYTIGFVIFNIDFNSFELNAIKALLGGHSQIHTFPLFQYFPIYLFGLYFGQFLYNQQDLFKRFKITLLWLVAFIALSIQANIVFSYINNNLFNSIPIEGRFPPSPAFLSLSLVVTFSAFTIILLLYKIIPSFIKAFLHYLGSHALEFFFFHTAILFTYKYITSSLANPGGQRHPYTFDMLIIYIAVIVLCIIATGAKNSVKQWALSELDDIDKENTWWLFTEKALTTVVFVIVISLAGTTLYRDLFVSNSKATASDVQFKKRLIREEEWPRWWDNKFSAFKQVDIKNNGAFTLFAGNWAQIKFDHGSAVLGHGSKTDASDVRIVYFDQEKAEFKELPILVDSPNTNNTKISFKVSKNIDPKETDNNYFLYYGNDLVGSYSKAQDRPTNTPYSDGITLGSEFTHSVKASINKKWYLKRSKASSSTILLNVSIDSSLVQSGSIVTYRVVGTNIFGRMKNVGGSDYQASVSVANLEPGAYTIQANVTESSESLKIFRSKEVAFNLSYPIYVTWTMDWEGWEVSDANLSDLASIADRYGMPMTHFFNPRIYVKNQYTITTIDKNTALKMTKWVQDRQKDKFEEIGLHLHMWPDMVAETGVTPKSFPVIQGTYGVDVATYNYSQEELEKIFRWGREKLTDNALGLPLSYRTGAWMSGAHVLRAAQNAGFLIDSSGRTGGLVNDKIAGSTPVPWTLTPTTKPYLPNVNDINKWEGERLKLWEFPNNGADSYWFSANELINRFDQNYPNKGSIVTRPQVVTYLSHPHWFVAVDTGKIRTLFNYTDKYLYNKDAGPVIYDTLENIYFDWDREKFINGN